MCLVRSILEKGSCLMKRLAVYLAVTFGLTWGLMIPAGIALGTFAHGESSSPVMMGLIALSMFFPLVGALVANLVSAPEERIDLAVRPRVKQNVSSYLLAWFIPAGIALVGDIAFFALNPRWFDPTMTAYIATLPATAAQPAGQLATQMPPTPGMLVMTLALALVVAPFLNMIPAFGEEVGWRGMLFPMLAERMSERAAALVSGVIWGLWHAPSIAMGHNYGMGYAGFPVAGILTMALLCTAMACCLAYLRKRSESVWPCALAHGAFNAIANVGLVFCSVGTTLYGPTPLGLVAGIPLITLGAIALWRLSPSRRA